MERQPRPIFNPAAEAGLPPVNQKAYTERVSGTIRSIETVGEERCNEWIEKRLEYGRLFQDQHVDQNKVATMKAELDADFKMLSREEQNYAIKKVNAIKQTENTMRNGNA